MSPLLWPMFFLAGLVEDWLITRYYQSVSSGRREVASGLSFIISLYNFGISLILIVNQDWISAAFLAVGTGLGTFLAMKKKE